MTAATHPTMSPDVYAILLDIAKQPDSILLTVEPRQASREFLHPSDPIRSTAAFLTSAERHLLDAHREEVATLTRQLAMRELAEHPRIATRIHFHIAVAKPLQYRPAEDVRREWRIAMSDPRASRFQHRFDGPGMHALGRPDRLERSTALVVLAQRLARHSASTVHAGLVEFARGDLGAADRRFTELVPTSGINGRVAREWKGAVAAERNAFGDARDAYASATRSAYATWESAVSWALNALQLGDVNDVQEATAALRDLGEFGSDVARQMGHRFAHLGWRPTRECKAIAARAMAHGSALEEVFVAAAG